jgi:serine/threonine-protein kinase
MKRCLVALAAATSLALLAPTARAEGASNQAAAQALFEQARALMNDGKFAEACPKLAESQRLDPGAGTLLNLGHCYEKNGQTASAWVTFKDAAAAADLKHRDDWAQRARERAAALEKVLSRLVIDVPEASRVDGLRVRRDGVDVGPAEWGVPIPIDPGEHAVDAVAPGKKRWETKATVGANADQPHVAVPALEDEPAPPPPATPEAPPPAPVVAPPPSSTTATMDVTSGPSWQRTGGLALGGVGIVDVAVGLVLGVRAIGRNNDAKTLCPTTTCSSQDGIQANDDAKSAATLSTIAVVSGAALVGAGAVLYFTAPSRGSGAASIGVSPWVGANAGGARVGGAF